MILIISDIHLGHDAQSTKQAHAVLSSIEKYQKAAHPDTLELYLLGDILNVYAGEGTPLAQPFFWQTLKDMPIKCYFMAGNRDFLITQKVLAPFNITLVPDPLFLNLPIDALNPKRTLKVMLSHGDAWVKNDHIYRLFRQITRLSFVQSCFLSMPTAWRTRMALGLRKKSQESKMQLQPQSQTSKLLNSTSSTSSTSYYSEIDIALLQKKYHDVDVVIHGHTHHPRQNIYTSGVKPFYYFVTSDWHQGHGYVISIKKAIELTYI